MYGEIKKKYAQNVVMTWLIEFPTPSTQKKPRSENPIAGNVIRLHQNK
jgi:hypothetical protein